MTNNFSFLHIFSPTDPVVFITSLLLIAGSIISWTIIIGKFRLWNVEKIRPTKITVGDNLDTIADKLIEPYDKNLWFLSMASAVAPFVGLFGTIWGIMELFAAIGATSSTSLAVIAPGLAIALGETALGLIVAIPAAISYQFFSKKSDDLYNKLETQAKEMKGK
ncbi:MAG: MotA/TolQ/ExbB proton channel family protein [Alphaproteobacteria bacterium]|nr:MotA/TolQ/ExbB proton channel family protein [Alphaproteobacteria bacterium]